MSDYLLDRLQLKSKISFWRNVAMCILMVLAIYIYSKSYNTNSASILKESHIARISIEGEIEENFYRDQVLNNLAKDDSIKAVILHLNTPGGTVYGGENLYNSIRKISNKKPVVAVMGTYAASAGYMVALAADSVFAGNTSTTGSIGVILITEEFSELAKKIGVDFVVLKSGKLKSEPLFNHKMTDEVKEVIMDLIMDNYNFFVDIVSERRKIPRDQVLKLADGRIFTGRQALENRLIDAIGGEDEAVNWLIVNKNMPKDLPIKDFTLYKEEKIYEKFVGPLNKINTILDYATNFTQSTQNQLVFR
jgi:protease-4